MCSPRANFPCPAGIGHHAWARINRMTDPAPRRAGVATTGAGAIVFFTAPRSKTGNGAAVGMAPAAEGAGLSIAGRF